MFYSNERIAYNGRGFNTAKAAKRGRIFAASGKAGCEVPQEKAWVKCLKCAAD
jgi:hypothetical protein